MTMREKLIEAAVNAPRAVGHRQHMEAVLDAILATLREPDGATIETMARDLADNDFPEMGERDFGYDNNPDGYKAAFRNAARQALAAMIDHIRSGK